MRHANDCNGESLPDGSGAPCDCGGAVSEMTLERVAELEALAKEHAGWGARPPVHPGELLGLLALARRALERNNADLALEESKLQAYDDIEGAVLTSEGEEPHPEEVVERVLLSLRELQEHERRALEQPVPTGEVTREHREAAINIINACHRDKDDEWKEDSVAQLLATREAQAFQAGRESAQGGWVAVAEVLDVGIVGGKTEVTLRCSKGQGVAWGALFWEAESRLSENRDHEALWLLMKVIAKRLNLETSL